MNDKVKHRLLLYRLLPEENTVSERRLHILSSARRVAMTKSDARRVCMCVCMYVN